MILNTIFFAFSIAAAAAITTTKNDTAAYFLWSLSNLAVQKQLDGRETNTSVQENDLSNNDVFGQTRQYYPGPPSQYYNPQSQQNPHYGFQNYQQYYQQNKPSYPARPAYNSGQYAPNYPINGPFRPPFAGPFPTRHPPANPLQLLPSIGQQFTQAINLIARNDELQCIPRLLCEYITSPESISQYRQAGGLLSGLSGLPGLSGINVDMSSILGMLSTINGFAPSPIITFARAALLGYTNRKNPNMCFQSYPNCPRNPDQLVNYLNNYNGGFFRYFGGVQQQYPPNQLNFPNQGQNPPNQPYFPHQGQGQYPANQQYYPNQHQQNQQYYGQNQYPPNQQYYGQNQYPPNQQYYGQNPSNQQYQGQQSQYFSNQPYYPTREQTSQQQSQYSPNQQYYPTRGQTYQQDYQNQGQQSQYPYRKQYFPQGFTYQPGTAQKRILSKPSENQNNQIFANLPNYHKSIAFPSNSISNNYEDDRKYAKTTKSWKFPEDFSYSFKDSNNYNQYNQRPYDRNPKSIPFNRFKVKPVEVIYPDRTGTGELVLDL